MAWLGHLTRWKINPFVWTDCKLGYFLFYFAAQYSSMILVIMSIEKLFALYFPLKAKSYCTVQTAKWVTSILAITFVGLNVPVLIFYKFDVEICVITKHSGFIQIMYTVFYALLPIVVMILANAAIIYKLMYIKYKGISHTNESVSKSSTRGSVMVVTVSLAFIILTSPRAIDNAVGFELSVNPFSAFFVVSMQYLNHSINAILYCIFGEKFRKELFTVMPCCGNNTLHTNSPSMNCSNTETTTDGPT